MCNIKIGWSAGNGQYVTVLSAYLAGKMSYCVIKYYRYDRYPVETGGGHINGNEKQNTGFAGDPTIQGLYAPFPV